MTAYRVRVMREALGYPLGEESVWEEAGSALEAEQSMDIHFLRRYYEQTHTKP